MTDPLTIWAATFVAGLALGAAYAGSRIVYERWVTTSYPDLPDDHD